MDLPEFESGTPAMRRQCATNCAIGPCPRPFRALPPSRGGGNSALLVPAVAAAPCGVLGSTVSGWQARTAICLNPPCAGLTSSAGAVSALSAKVLALAGAEGDAESPCPLDKGSPYGLQVSVRAGGLSAVGWGQLGFDAQGQPAKRGPAHPPPATELILTPGP